MRDEGEINFDQLSDVSASFRVEYARTSFDEESELLFAGMAVVNAAPIRSMCRCSWVLRISATRRCEFMILSA